MGLSFMGMNKGLLLDVGGEGEISMGATEGDWRGGDTADSGIRAGGGWEGLFCNLLVGTRVMRGRRVGSIFDSSQD